MFRALGAKGVSSYYDDEVWHANLLKIVVDTVEASDASAGGMIYSLATRPQRGWDDHLRFAVAAGANPPGLGVFEGVTV